MFGGWAAESDGHDRVVGAAAESDELDLPGGAAAAAGRAVIDFNVQWCVAVGVVVAVRGARQAGVQ